MKHNSRKNKTKSRRTSMKNNKSMFAKTMVEAGVTNLLGIGAFYKNDDLEKGVGFYISPQDIEGVKHMDKASKGLYDSAMKYVKAGKLTVNQLIDDVLDQLENNFVPYFKSNPDKLSDKYYENMILTFGNIYILQDLGVIESDEYNGMTYQYGNEKTYNLFA